MRRPKLICACYRCAGECDACWNLDRICNDCEAHHKDLAERLESLRDIAIDHKIDAARGK
ncbi:MAG: hypothetical protein LN413_00175 [Candidatus Thermoplasmatota archaeon]|nr:hypothetical protein [Candidatus Thermoplasmatota archaeon]